jgi:hypothetical protein
VARDFGQTDKIAEVCCSAKIAQWSRPGTFDKMLLFQLGDVQINTQRGRRQFWAN